MRVQAIVRTALAIVGVVALGVGYFAWMGATTTAMHLGAAVTFAGGAALILASDALAKRARRAPSEEKDSPHAN